MKLTRYEQVLSAIEQIGRPALAREILELVEARHNINRQNLSVILSTMVKRGDLTARLADGRVQTKVYGLPEQPKERGREKLHRPAATPSAPKEPSAPPESQSAPCPAISPMAREIGRGPLFFDCSDGQLDDLFADHPVAQDVAEQIIRRMGDGETPLTKADLRPSDCDDVVFLLALGKLVRAGIIQRSADLYARPGHPGLAATLDPQKPGAHSAPQAEPTNQDPAAYAFTSHGPATEPVTHSAADSQQAAAPRPDQSAHALPGGIGVAPDGAAWAIKIDGDLRSSLDDFHTQLRQAVDKHYTPTTSIRASLLDLDDLIGELCTAEAPHAVIRAVHTASASLRHAAELLNAHRATISEGATT